MVLPTTLILHLGSRRMALFCCSFFVIKKESLCIQQMQVLLPCKILIYKVQDL